MVVGILVSAFLVSGCAQPEGEPSGDEGAEGEGVRTLVVGHTGNPGNMWYVYWNELSVRLPQATNGQIILEVHPAGEIGADQKILEDASMGTIDGCHSSVENLQAYSDAYTWASMPGLIPPDKVLGDDGIWRSDIAKDCEEEVMKDTGLKPIAYCPIGYRILYTREPVHSPADAEGIKIRVTESKVEHACMQAWGLNPTPIPWAELFGAMQQGIVDACYIGLGPFINVGFADLLKYGCRVHGVPNNHIEYISVDTWNSFSSDLQQTFWDTAKETESWVWEKYITELAPSQLERCREKGVTHYEPTEEEQASWDEKAQSIWPKFEDEVDQKMLQRAQEFCES
jgi:TRAP-type C4-dicarboxylate transport system substrate-binding protein